MTTHPNDALIVGDTSDLSAPTREWLDSLPTQNTVAEVFRRHMIGTEREDRREERARAQKLEEFQSHREDVATAMALHGETMPTLGDRFKAWAALAELEEREDDRRRARRAEERAEQQAQRVRELETALAREKLEHSRASWLASDRLDGWTAERRRAAREAEQSQQSNYSSYPRYRNYWE